MANKKLQKAALQSSALDLPVEVLDPLHSAQYYSLKMPAPRDELAHYVDHYWIMRWDVPSDTSFTAEIIPSPYINLTFMKQGASITGVTTGKYTYEVQGSGVIVGTKFHPGGYYALTGHTASEVTDKVIPAQEIFTQVTQRMNDQIISAPSDEKAIELMEHLLLSRLPQPNDNLELIRAIINDIKENDRSTVSSLVTAHNISERRLQELFKTYVGVSPKWVILRYRLIKASHLAIKPTSQKWTEIAIDLGYSDQSHFINDFKRIIGKTPKEYSKIASSE